MRSYELAKALDEKSLEQHLKDHCVDEWLPGEICYSAVSKLAEEDNRHAVELLLRFGAGLNYAGMGAARGGHQTYADALLTRGANINWVAEGAAQGGHQAYAETLLAHGANISWVAEGAAWGGHQTYAEALLEGNASINSVALGAAQGGHKAYAQALLARGADIDLVALGVGAKQGEYKAYAEALLTRGASIDLVALGAALGGHQAYAEALLARGAKIDLVAVGAGRGGHQTYAEALLARGADIDSVALGAGRGGHQAYADALLTRGASIDSVALGAALGGHQAYAEALLTRGANIHLAALGAAKGGHQAYADALLERGADIDSVALGAADGGHQAYADALLTRGANINMVAERAAKGGHINRDNPTLQLRYLSQFQPRYTAKLAGAFASLENPVVIPEAIIQQVPKLQHLRESGFTFEAARLATVRNQEGRFMHRRVFLFAILLFIDDTDRLSFFCKDIWIEILNRAVAANFSKQDWLALAVITAKIQIQAALTDYMGKLGRSRDEQEMRATGFAAALDKMTTLSDLRVLVKDQATVVKSENEEAIGTDKHQQSLQNKTVNGYHLLINLWAKRLRVVPAAKPVRESQYLHGF